MARVKRAPKAKGRLAPRKTKAPQTAKKPPVNDEPQPPKTKRMDLAKHGILEKVKNNKPRIWCAHCDARNLTVIDAVRHYKDSHDARLLEIEKPYWVFENYYNSRHGTNSASRLARIRNEIVEFINYDDPGQMPNNPWTQPASELEDYKSPEVLEKVNRQVLDIAP